MIEDTIGTYLTAPAPPHKDASVSSVPALPISLCIIETRLTFWLPKVLQNALDAFPQCTIFVVAPANVLTWLTNTFPSVQSVRGIAIPPQIGSRNTFNAVMYNPEFWTHFSTPYVLMFQCDTCFVRGASTRLSSFMPFKHVYYGAVCGSLQANSFIINGGLSLRHVETFQKVLKTATETDMKEDEDIMFTRALRTQGYSLPTIGECMDFAVESLGNPSRAIGIHGSDKYYAPPSLIAAMFGQASVPIFDCVMYNGEPIFRKRLSLLENIVEQFIVVESRLSHSGVVKELEYPLKFPNGHPKVTYIVVDTFPAVPESFRAGSALEIREAWWRERYQRDYARLHVPDVDGLVLVNDVDELPDPSSLLAVSATAGCHMMKPRHLLQEFLIYTPNWVKNDEVWLKAYICGTRSMPQSMTDQRCRGPGVSPLITEGGWHCSFFFDDIEEHIRKVKHFAHREFKSHIDREVIRDRIERGQDPFDRGDAFNGTATTRHHWLEYV